MPWLTYLTPTPPSHVCGMQFDWVLSHWSHRKTLRLRLRQTHLRPDSISPYTHSFKSVLSFLAVSNFQGYEDLLWLCQALPKPQLPAHTNCWAGMAGAGTVGVALAHGTFILCHWPLAHHVSGSGRFIQVLGHVVLGGIMMNRQDTIHYHYQCHYHHHRHHPIHFFIVTAPEPMWLYICFIGNINSP